MVGRVSRELGGVDWELGVGRGRLGAAREQDVGQGR